MKNKKENNLFLKFRKYLEVHVSNRVKFSTGNDLFDWVSIFILFGVGSGLIALLVIRTFIDLRDAIPLFVFWFTAFAIVRYTKETYWLKQLEQKNLKFQKAPFIIIHFEPKRVDASCSPSKEIPDCFVLKNVGRGVARNVKWGVVSDSYLEGIDSYVIKEIKEYKKFKTIISPDGGYTRIEVDNAFLVALKPNKNVDYEIEINYQNIDGDEYFTRLKSGLAGDDYEVLNYGKANVKK